MSFRLRNIPIISGVNASVPVVVQPPVADFTSKTYSTWSPGDKATSIVLTNNNLTAARQESGNTWVTARGTEGKTSGKWYVEYQVSSVAVHATFGFSVQGSGLETFIGNTGIQGFTYYPASDIFHVNGFTASGTTPWTSAPGVYGFAIDITAKKAWLRNADGWIGDPEAGTGNTFSWTGNYTILPGMSTNNGLSAAPVTANFGQSAFSYAVPEGFNSGWYSVGTISGFTPLTVNFEDVSANTPTSWAWDFQNNGSTDSTQQNPIFTYSTEGTWPVKLTATNTAGSDQEIKTGYVTTTRPFPVVKAVSSTNQASTTGTHNINMPAGIQVGDLLVVVFAVPGTFATTAVGLAGATVPDGYAAQVTGSSNYSLYIGYRIATGSDSITFTTSPNRTSATAVFRIQGASGLLGINYTTGTMSTTARAIPGLGLSAGNDRNNLWVCGIAGISNTRTISSQTGSWNLGPDISTFAGLNANHVRLMTFQKSLKTISEDTGSLVMSGADGTNPYVGFKFAVIPPKP